MSTLYCITVCVVKDVGTWQLHSDTIVDWNQLKFKTIRSWLWNSRKVFHVGLKSKYESSSLMCYNRNRWQQRLESENAEIQEYLLPNHWRSVGSVSDINRFIEFLSRVPTEGYINELLATKQTLRTGLKYATWDFCLLQWKCL